MSKANYRQIKASKPLLVLFPENTLTLEVVFDKISKDPSLSLVRKRDLQSSLRVAAAALQLPLAQAVADPEWLRRRLATVAPARLNLAKKTWANILANLKAALVLAGVVKHVGRGRHLNGEWGKLWEQLKDPNLKLSLTRFVTFCSREGVCPSDVSDETVSEFALVLRRSSLRKDPDLALYYLTRCWNKASISVSGWPTQLVTVPKRRIVFKVDDELLPSSFQCDLARYLSVMACANPLADNAPPRPLSPVSLAQYRRQILRFFGELVSCGMVAETIVNLGVMVRPENVEKGLRAMLDRKGGRTSQTIYGMAYMLKTIAKHYVQLPADDIAKLDVLCRRLKVRQVGMTEKNRKRLRQFDDEGQAARILNLPAELLAEARQGKRSPKRCAMLVEVALAVELLLMTALRIKNLAELHLDRNIEFSRATRDRVCHLVVASHQVKNGQHLEFELDVETTALLQMFVEKYRPLLVSTSSRWLFGRRDADQPVSTTVLSQRISKTIRDRTGLEVNPHLFRSLGGKLYLDRHPGGFEVVRRLLGHTNMSTTLKAYTGLESTSAAKHFDQTIRSLRDGMARPRSRRGMLHRKESRS